MIDIDLINQINDINQKQLHLDNKNKKLIKELKDNGNSNSEVTPDNSTNNNSNNAIGRKTVKSSALDKTVAMTHKANASTANSILNQIGMSNPSNYKPKDTKRAYDDKNKLHVKKHYRNTGLSPQSNPFLNPNARTPKSSGGSPSVA